MLLEWDASAHFLAPAPKQGSRPAWLLISLFPIRLPADSLGEAAEGLLFFFFFFVRAKKNCHKFIYLKDFSPENSPLRLLFSESESLT